MTERSCGKCFVRFRAPLQSLLKKFKLILFIKVLERLQKLMLASASDAIIIGFNVRPAGNAKTISR
jgi:hypothetical protein